MLLTVGRGSSGRLKTALKVKALSGAMHRGSTAFRLMEVLPDPFIMKHRSYQPALFWYPFAILGLLFLHSPLCWLLYCLVLFSPFFMGIFLPWCLPQLKATGSSGWSGGENSSPKALKRGGISCCPSFTLNAYVYPRIPATGSVSSTGKRSAYDRLVR